MVAVGQKQSFRGVDDDHGRQGVEGPGVALDSRGVEVSFGVDRRVREQLGYPQTAIAYILAVRPKARNPYSSECVEGKFSEVRTAAVLHQATFLCRGQGDVAIHT